MYCEKCGSSIENGSTYCAFCGSSITEKNQSFDLPDSESVMVNVLADSVSNESDTSEKAKNQWRTVVIALLWVAFSAFVIAVIANYFSGNNTDYQIYEARLSTRRWQAPIMYSANRYYQLLKPVSLAIIMLTALLFTLSKKSFIKTIAAVWTLPIVFVLDGIVAFGVTGDTQHIRFEPNVTRILIIHKNVGNTGNRGFTEKQYSGNLYRFLFFSIVVLLIIFALMYTVICLSKVQNKAALTFMIIIVVILFITIVWYKGAYNTLFLRFFFDIISYACVMIAYCYAAFSLLREKEKKEKLIPQPMNVGYFAKAAYTQMNPVMKFCPSCGIQYTADKKFCDQCGSELKEVASTVATDQPSYYQKNPLDAPSGGYAFLGFLIPIVGLILYLTWKDQFPLRAKSCGKGALIGFITYIILSIAAALIPLIILGSAFK